LKCGHVNQILSQLMTQERRSGTQHRHWKGRDGRRGCGEVRR
jgi:hypothetical protein